MRPFYTEWLLKFLNFFSLDKGFLQQQLLEKKFHLEILSPLSKRGKMALPVVQGQTYMLAREVPLLKGKQLCAFLEQMDQEEQGLATQERQAAAEQVRVLK